MQIFQGWAWALEMAEPRLVVDAFSPADIVYLALRFMDIWVVDCLVSAGYALMSWGTFTTTLVAEFGLD